MKKKILIIILSILALLIVASGAYYLYYMSKPAVLIVATDGERFLLKDFVKLEGYRTEYYDIASDKEIDLTKYECILASPIAADIIDNEKRDFFNSNSPITASFSREDRANTVFDIQFIKDDVSQWLSYIPNADAVILYDSSSSTESNIADNLSSVIKRRSFERNISSMEINSIETYLSDNQLFTILSTSPEKAATLFRNNDSLMIIVPLWYVKSIETFKVYGYVGEDFNNIVNILTQSDVSSFRSSGLPVSTPYSFFVK